MRDWGKFISRHLLIFTVTIAMILVIDILMFGLVFQGIINGSYVNTSPPEVIEEIAGKLSNKNGNYDLPVMQKEFLKEQNIWGMLIAPDGSVVWDNELPQEIQDKYSLQDVALLSRGYLKDYPVFVWSYRDYLLVLGYPKNSYTKFLQNYLPLNVVRNIPVFFTVVFIIDILLLFIACFLSKRRITKNIAPIVNAVSQLSQGRTIVLETTGSLSEIVDSLNKTSAILDKKDKARANWISGVSHDIRTPLSIIMGYADRISSDDSLSVNTKEQALIIRSQSVKIKELIQDLNLTSQLEYDMQPICSKVISPAKLLREVVTEYLNNELSSQYSLDLEIDENAQNITMDGDARLLKRAINNLIHNSINHNPQGCSIIIKMNTDIKGWKIVVSDNGSGISEQELKNIKIIPHYMKSTDEGLDLRHGMGLLLVQQIIDVHHGKIQFVSKKGMGFSIIITFEINSKSV